MKGMPVNSGVEPRDRFPVVKPGCQFALTMPVLSLRNEQLISSFKPSSLPAFLLARHPDVALNDLWSDMNGLKPSDEFLARHDDVVGTSTRKPLQHEYPIIAGDCASFFRLIVHQPQARNCCWNSGRM